MNRPSPALLLFCCAALAFVAFEAFGQVEATSPAPKVSTPPVPAENQPAAEPIEFEVIYADWRITTAELAAIDKGGPESADAIKKLITAAESAGTTNAVERIRFDALSQNRASVMFGARKPRITGSNVTPRGQMNQFTMDEVGTNVTVGTRLDGNNIFAELSVERSGLEGGGPVIAESAGGEKVKSESVGRISAKTQVRIPSGHTVVLCTQTSTSAGEARRQVLLVKATIAK